MWIEDFRNKNAVKESQISEAAVVDWFNYCRLEFEQIKTRIGGSSKIIEIDEMCWVKQKHNRGKPEKGTHQWYFGCVERGKQVKRSFSRQKSQTVNSLQAHQKMGATRHNNNLRWVARLSSNGAGFAPIQICVISTQIPTLFSRHLLIRHKKKTGGGFSKMVAWTTGPS